MGATRPKQYLPLAGQPVLQRSLDCLLALPGLQQVVVALAADDDDWPTLAAASDPRVRVARGGAERCDSVLAGLSVLAEVASPDDWVLVHDAARPCLAPQDLQRLVDSLVEDAVGGLLALPVADTVKRVDADARVVETVDRTDLWLAQTPQMFRLGMLSAALRRALEQHQPVTDEASAMEWAGFQPKLVEGSPTNIKITRPGDLILAESFLRNEAASGEADRACE
jgi:2-C-methyl-D-erythritol 4-phosphate cytidylyltransferase